MCERESNLGNFCFSSRKRSQSDLYEQNAKNCSLEVFTFEASMYWNLVERAADHKWWGIYKNIYNLCPETRERLIFFVISWIDIASHGHGCLCALAVLSSKRFEPVLFRVHQILDRRITATNTDFWYFPVIAPLLIRLG